MSKHLEVVKTAVKPVKTELCFQNRLNRVNNNTSRDDTRHSCVSSAPLTTTLFIPTEPS